MPKWFDETVLIKYWEECCQKYTLKGNVKIREAARNPSFGRYPDIAENVLSTGEIVPAEIEWLTTNFDRHGHDIRELDEKNGFLIVFKQDASFVLPQIEIDRDDFLEWFKRRGENLAIETLSEIESQAKKSKEPQIFLFYLPKRSNGEKNFKIALDHGTWGFPEDSNGVRRGLPQISSIKKGDIVVFVYHWKKSPKSTAKGGRVSSEQFFGTYEKLFGLVVTEGYFTEKKKIWDDGEYPHRFKFRKKPLFEGENIPVNKKSLGSSLHEMLRILLMSGSIQKIDGSLMTKLMSLCTS